MFEIAQVRRRRTERGPRSKSGCRTCILKKVKCDENRPQCHRCVRLQLECEWPIQPPSLSSRRRGLGPIKTRDAWAPQTILPKSPNQSSLSHFPQADETSGDTSTPLATTQCQRRDLFFNPANPSSPDPVESGIDQPNFLSTPIATAIHDQYAEYPIVFPIQSLPLHHFLAGAGAVLLPSHGAVNHAPSLGISDSQALLFHRTVFAALKSTRKATSSAHCLFLSLALRNAMSLHFLLAVSHNELALHLGSYRQPPQEAWNHLQHGSRIFLQALNPLAPLNHVGTLLSFLYMYMF
ncbi:uncharacterized protein N7511_001980 [Penicillium nucicola]|uniref:uncharacterized protein n=1 Tax=Penicillium nucicola TaxID=1850975 RepID=UPI0025459B02|nr:uncharacterized protein N7511_001980 [Penicillium nucicola]KAJ5769929.1 hypothetical protein N7511_001980 [Penicillium nucicola]